MAWIRKNLLVVVIASCSVIAAGCGSVSAVQVHDGRGSRMAFAETADDRGGIETSIIRELPKVQALRTAGEGSPAGIDPARVQRLVIYNAVIHVVVDRIRDSLEHIKSVVVNMGGYMHSMSSDSITLKVPADKFNAAIAELEKTGEVIKKEISGTDVTDKMRDLNIRLANAEKFRERLIELLDKADKVEDALKIEKELERITRDIELHKGKIAHLKNSMAFSTLTVRFNSPVPQREITKQTPFRWVHKLGAGLTRNVSRGTTRQTRSIWAGSMFELPEDFISFYEDNYRSAAMSAANVIIDMRKHKNYKGGSVDFWGDLVRGVLVEQKVFSIAYKTEITLNNKRKAVLIEGTKQIGTKTYSYLIAIATKKKHVYALEAWGSKEDFTLQRNKLLDCVKTMRLK